MASLPASLAAICTLISFAYLTETLERHSLAGRPRLSSLLILLLSGTLCFFASFFAKFLPGSHGRFDSYQRLSKTLPSSSDDEADPSIGGTTPAQLPPRPRRYSIPLLVCCIVIRLELFHRVNYQQQCAVAGVESFLPVLLWFYETIINPRLWRQPVKEEEDDDPWRSVFDDLRDWITSAQPMLAITLMSLLAISMSTFLSMRQFTPSNYVCFAPTASSSKTFTLQLCGLFLDAAIIILFWRQLAWSRTTKARLRSLGSVLTLSSALMGTMWLGNRITRGARPLDLAFGSLYVFDIIFDSFLFTVLAISAAFWVCSATTVIPVTITTILVGLQATGTNISVLGNWDHLSRTPVLFPLWLMTFSTFWFAYNQPVKTFIFLKRGFFIFLLLVILVAGTIYGLSRPKDWYPRHPVGDLIYRSQREHTSWLNKAKTSMSLPIAVKIYKELHGRDPPPYFHEWYGFAKNTAVVDFFQQIDTDLKPFHNVSPWMLRDRVQVAASLPGVATITIEKGGKVSRNDVGVEKEIKELDKLVDIITKYSKWLPEMTIPINLDSQPRILPSWQESQSIQHAHLGSVAGLSNEGKGNITAADRSTSAKTFQAMHLEACSPNSKSRRHPHWRVGEFCSKCTRRHSKSAMLTRWGRSLEVCQQPDIHQLHGFFLTDPASAPIGDLLPLFGPSKMDGFDDIIFPLPSSIDAEEDVPSEIWERYDTLIWRGIVGEHAISSAALGGSHKFRLANLVTSPDTDDKVTLISTEGEGKKQRFFWETVSAAEASDVLPLSIGFKSTDQCTDAACAMVKQAYPQDKATSSILSYRYVLITDEDDGPPRDMMSVLRSGSVPFLATTFKTWYTERLTPWMHFVPIDLRYQGLYATYAYFTGTIGRKPINGREARMKAQRDDAEFIAHSGKKWADKAIGQMDMEMYIFRLLLEWGRLIDDKRDTVGFIKDDKGELKNTGWSLRDADVA